ncbi:uncharacterized protein SCHCODRAFT_01121114, partial [Schizophyllum commune H4-8]|uniref:uncharacterized protein n=1 Tax=Schizophyllum commune (strain H4-8 / FGSC 9210) TaxID=578458 RepID=UPI00215E29C1
AYLPLAKLPFRAFGRLGKYAGQSVGPWRVVQTSPRVPSHEKYRRLHVAHAAPSA